MNRKSYTIENLVTHMARHAANRKSGAWYNVPVALDKERHTSTEQNWNHLLNRLQECIQKQAASVTEASILEWKMDLVPATKDFVVDHVINEGAQFRKPRYSLNEPDPEFDCALIGMGEQDLPHGLRGRGCCSGHAWGQPPARPAPHAPRAHLPHVH